MADNELTFVDFNSGDKLDIKATDNKNGTYSISTDQIQLGTIREDFKTYGSLEGLISAINLGLVSDATNINKFSRAILQNNVLSLASSFNNPNPFLDTPTTLYLSSSNANDTFEVIIYYTDFNYDMQEITATLNGQTAIELGNDIRSIWRMENNSGTDHQGTISVGSEATPSSGLPDPENTYCNMVLTSGVPANQSTTCVFTVPRGYNAIVYNPYVTVNKGADVLSAGFARTEGKTFKYKIGLSSYESSSEHNGYQTLVSEKTDLKILAIAQTGGITYFEYGIVLFKLPTE